MKLNIAERFPGLDADAANIFIHLSSMHYYSRREDGTNPKQPSAKNIAISEVFLLSCNQSKTVIADIY